MYEKGNKHTLEFTRPLKISSQINRTHMKLNIQDIKGKGMQNAGKKQKKTKHFHITVY